MSGIGGIGTSYYSNLMDTLGTAAGSADKLKDTLDRLPAASEGASEAEDKELMEACRSFESYFIEQVFKGMEKTVMKDEDEEENDYLANFKDILYQNYASNAVEKGEFGIAQMLYDSMKRV